LYLYRFENIKTMNWDQLLSVKRLGKPSSGKITEESRTEFQRDYDRLIFSSPFRRLQNKTQVFPLPGSIFVHNRLTHSLEVASVGRSLGNMIAFQLEEMGFKHPLIPEIGPVSAAACLAHDLGNPPFGHSGEDAIKEFFKNGNGKNWIAGLEEAQKLDFTTFDGNANTLRMLGHQFSGRREGGFALTYTMLASIVKYPYESTASGKKDKFGFYQSEKQSYSEIADELGLTMESNKPLKYVRHPLVYLVEAADDICYQIMDIEDAHKLKILSFKETRNLYLNFYNPAEDVQLLNGIKRTLKEVTDPNEQIAYLRAGVINLLVKNCVEVFRNNYDSIMNGQFNKSLIKDIPLSASTAMKEVIDVSINRIYSHTSVVEIELAGYKIISTLLQHFTDAILNESNYGKKLLKLFPQQFVSEKNDAYSQIQSVVDFVSGMTDVFALDLYRKITGIGLTGV
jgi:dGTPase